MDIVRNDSGLINTLRRYKIHKHSLKQPPIKLIRNPTAIDNLAHKILDGIKGNLIKISNKIINNGKTRGEITLIEIIQNIPPQRPKLPPLQNNRMKQTQIKRKGFLLLGFAPCY